MDSTDLSSSTVCSVCSGSSNGFFFGVRACRACAAFFRRSALEKRQYACRRSDGKCQIHIDGMRNSCRSCRMKRCFEVGMTVSRIPNNRGNTIENNTVMTSSHQQSLEIFSSHSSTNITTAPTVIITADKLISLNHNHGQIPSHIISTKVLQDADKVPEQLSKDPSLPATMSLHQLQYPISSQIAQSLRNMANAHRALISILDGSNSNWIKVPNQPSRLRLMKINDFLQIDRGNVPLLLGIIREFFPQIDTLDTKSKVRIVKNYDFHIGCFYDSDRTVRIFSGTDIRNLVIWYTGCILDKDHLEEYFGDMADVNERIQAIMPTFDKWLNFIWNRLAPLELSPSEFNALVGLQLCNCIESVVPLSSDLSAKRDQLFVELHKMCADREHSDLAKTAIRFGKLLQVLQEVAGLVWEFEELCNFCRIFYPPVPDWWDDAEGHKKLGLE